MELPVVQRLKKELEELKHELHSKLPKELETAREHGDLRENAEYEACKERQGLVNARIGQIEGRIRDCSLLSINSIPTDTVGYGSLVVLQDSADGEEKRYEIVFPEDVDAAAGQISLGSPLGRAMMSKGEGDAVEVRTPKGVRSYEIVRLQTIHTREDMKV
jgi:transcription elongation factor GreA